MKIDKEGNILYNGYKFHPDSLAKLATFAEIFTEKEALEINKMVMYCMAEMREKFTDIVPPETLRLIFELTHLIQQLDGEIEFPGHGER
jgi:hypothetical protein